MLWNTFLLYHLSNLLHIYYFKLHLFFFILLGKLHFLCLELEKRVQFENSRLLGVGRDRIIKVLRANGLKGIQGSNQKYHSYKGEIGRIASNIIDRNFTADKPLQKWTTDISQFNFSWGKCYLSPILDMATNEIISYDISLSPNMEQIKRMGLWKNEV